MSRLCASYVVGLCLASVILSQDLDPKQVLVSRAIDMQENGDAVVTVVLRFEPREYEEVRTSLDPRQFLHDWVADRPEFELGGQPVIVYRAADSSIAVMARFLGLARSADGRVWEVPQPPGEKFLESSQGEDGRQGFTFGATGLTPDGRFEVAGGSLVRPPEEAKATAWDGERRVVRYELAIDPGKGTDELTAALRTRPSVPVAAPAVWAARAVFQNCGDGSARGLKVRFRMEGYADASAWSAPVEVAPGQTVIVPYCPTFSRAAHWEQETAEGNVQVEWVYARSDGSEASGSSTRRVVLAPGGTAEPEPPAHVDVPREDLPKKIEVPPVESKPDAKPDLSLAKPAPLTPEELDDPRVLELVAIVRQRTADLQEGTPGRDARVVRVIYELLRERKFSCELTPELSDPALGTARTLWIHHQPCGDVVERATGTAVSIGYVLGAVCVHLGVKPMLVIVPDHLLFVAIDRAGQAVPLEVASEKAPELGPLLPYDQAVKKGEDIYWEAWRQGSFHFLDLCPEMKRRTEGPGTGGPGPGEDPGAVPPDPRPRETPPAAPNKRAEAWLKTWSGEWSEPLGGGKSVKIQGAITIEASDDPERFGIRFLGVDAATSFFYGAAAIGELQGDQLVFEQKARFVQEGNADKRQIAPCRGAARIVDGKLVVQYGNDDDGFSEFTLEKE